MPTKNTSNRIILNSNNMLDLMSLKKMVKEYIDKYYGTKFKVRKHINTGSFWSFQNVSSKTTLTTVFKEFKDTFMNDNRHIRKQFRYLNLNYNSKHKLRDLVIFKLKIDGYSFIQIVEIIGLSNVRVKQIYYKIKKIIDNNF